MLGWGRFVQAHHPGQAGLTLLLTSPHACLVSGRYIFFNKYLQNFPCPAIRRLFERRLTTQLTTQLTTPMTVTHLAGL
jgi:hypothetical protein